MIYRIVHRTRYDYDAPVTVSVGEVRQLVTDLDGQRCIDRDLTVRPEPEHQRERADYFGNRVALFSVREPHTTLEVVATATVDTSARAGSGAPVDGVATEPWERVTVGPGTDLEVLEYAIDSPLVVRSQDLVDYARPSFSTGRPVGEALVELCSRIHADFAFDPDATEVDTPLEEVLVLRRGVCQDFAHVLIGCLRSLGLAARYVSGYLETDPPPGQERLVGADRTHAWVGVHLGAGGWFGIDPTNDQPAAARYVTSAHGRDYGDVPPFKGVIFSEAETSTLTVSVDVAPEDPDAEASDTETSDSESPTSK
ncbi:MAG: transglutaminase family protein [Actinomycetota bacterium]